MVKVIVLMSTYNGEKYLKDQINSIFNQIDVEVKLLVRDDGSSDNTIMILNQDERLNYVEGENIGYRKSFLHLLEMCGDADYYAFADQDDIWDNDKLISAINVLEKSNNKLQLYCSNTRLVDEKLSFIKNETKDPKISLKSLMVKNFATGCTMVFNKNLLEVIKKYDPLYVSSHDSWIARVCAGLDGYIFFDYVPHISYRQHGNNTIGSSVDIWGKVKYRVRLITKDRSRSRKNTAKFLLDGYGNILNKKNENVLIKIYRQNCFDKLSIIFDTQFSCGKIIDDILFRVALVFGWI